MSAYELKKQLIALEKYYAEAKNAWHIFGACFRQKAPRTKLLNIDSEFFGLCGFTICSYVCLAVTRLTDPACTSGKENNSLPNLKERMSKNEQLKEKFSKLESDIMACNIAVNDMRKLRNKILTHADRDAWENDESIYLAWGTVDVALDKIKEALASASNLLEPSEGKTQYLTGDKWNRKILKCLEIEAEDT